MRKLMTLLLGSSLLVLTACGTEDADPAPPTPDEVCTAYATQICDKMTECAPFYVDFSFPSPALCVERTASDCSENLELDGVDLSGVDLDGCIDALGASTCDDVLGGGLPEVCVVAGTFTDGTACRDDAQCASSNCWTEESECGTCQPRAVAAGDSCAQAECPGGMYCDADDQCAVSPTIGEACSNDMPCRETASCVRETEEATEGVCTAFAGLGAACSNDAIGAPGCSFPEGLFCDPMGGTCIEIQQGAIGDACGYDFEAGTFGLCVADAFCQLGEDFSGTCVAKGEAGAACESEDECAYGLSCVDGLCADQDVVCE